MESMRMRSLKRVAVCVAVLVLPFIADVASAQIVDGQQLQVTQGLTYVSWDVSGDKNLTVAQWYIRPINAR